MKRNWYAVYTKPHCEKKVAASLSKKEIKNYYPLNCIVDFRDNRKRTVYEPLLSTLVFVYITDAEMAVIKKTSFVINFVYWLGKPAVIKNDEIANMQYFTTEYSNVKLEKTAVNPNEPGRFSSDPHIGMNGKIISAKNACIKLSLPSVGYRMVAEVEKSNAHLLNYSFEKSSLVS
jgi:transcription antitermination factor NusG